MNIMMELLIGADLDCFKGIFPMEFTFQSQVKSDSYVEKNERNTVNTRLCDTG